MFTGLLVLTTALGCQQALPSTNYDARFLERINLARKTAGLPPVAIDPELSRGCKLHADYLARNFDHPTTQRRGYNYEDPMLPGYSPQGQQTSRACTIYTWQGEQPLPTTDWLLATHYGRALALNPELGRMGVGVAIARIRPLIWVTVLDLHRGFKSRDPVAYPADRQTNVPRGYMHPEQPSPLTPEQQKTAGLPISLVFPFGEPVRNVKASLTDAAGKEVEIHLTSPQNSTVPEELLGNTVLIIPRQVLAPSMQYRVTVSGQFNEKPFQRSWTFTTGEEMHVKPDPAAPAADRINFYRKQAGLEPVTLDPVLSKGCQAHARYLLMNLDKLKLDRPGAVNTEDPKLPGYTEEGRNAARVSYVFFTAAGSAVDMFMGMALPRQGVLNPTLRRIGVGTEKNDQGVVVSVLDVNRGHGGGDQVVVYPAARQTGLPINYGVEQPDPIPESKDKKAGYPVTVMFAEGAMVTEVTARLTDQSGREVPAWISTPEKPAISAEFQRNTVLIIPKAALMPLRTYTATVTAKVNGQPWSRTWTFATGTGREP